MSLVLSLSSVCNNGKLHCQPWNTPLTSKSVWYDHIGILGNVRHWQCFFQWNVNDWMTASFTACRAPKVFFNCSTAGTGELGVQCAQTCRNLDSDDCVSWSFHNILPKINNYDYWIYLITLWWCSPGYTKVHRIYTHLSVGILSIPVSLIATEKK